MIRFASQLGVTMHGGSYLVINLFKQEVLSQKKDRFATVTTTIFFVIDSLTIFTTQIAKLISRLFYC